MPKAYHTLTLLSLAVLILVLVGAVGQVAAQVASPTPVEREPPTPEPIPTPTPLPAPVSAFLEAQAAVDTLPGGPATITVSTLEISPRVALRAIVTNGPVLILVERGTLTIDAEAALIGPPPTGNLESLQAAATPLPALASNFVVPDGNQILLPPDTRVQLRNTTDEAVELMITAIAPAGQQPFGVRSPARAGNGSE